MDPWSAYDMMQDQISQNNAWNAEQAQKQMDFQERMSNTAHQREVADLKASGLNPVLSAKLGGASTPSGAMAQSDPSATSALMNIIDRMLDVTQAQAYGNAYSAKGSYEAEVKDENQEFSDEEIGNLTGLALLGRTLGKGAQAVGHGIRWITNKANEGVKNIYNWFTGKGSGNKTIDDFTDKANTWLMGTAYPWLGNTAKNAVASVGDFGKKVGSWINNSAKAYVDAIAKSSDAIYGHSYTPKYNHGINTGLAFKNIVKPFSPDWYKYVKKSSYNPYKDTKNNYDPYKRIGTGKWLKQYK